ncbi:MAG TPA: hypothetical protein VEZ18_05665, partial [Geodermatophilus sp.]|nr:hypothetical protein [Geodermatophilus sp.]
MSSLVAAAARPDPDGATAPAAVAIAATRLVRAGEPAGRAAVRAAAPPALPPPRAAGELSPTAA